MITTQRPVDSLSKVVREALVDQLRSCQTQDEILNLLTQLSKEQVLIVVTHEPELFSKWVSESHRLQEGTLKPIKTNFQVD